MRACEYFLRQLSAPVMPSIKVRSIPPPVRPARTTGAIFAKFDQDRPLSVPKQPFHKPELQEEDPDSDADRALIETDVSDYEEGAEEGTGGDSDCAGSAFGEPDDGVEDETDFYDCEYFEIPCTKARPSVFKHRNGQRRPHVPCPRLVEEEYLEE